MTRYFILTFLILNSLVIKGQSDMNSKIYTSDTVYKVNKNDTIELQNGFSFIFKSHSHKRTYADGPESPLIINIEYLVEDKIETEVYYIHESMPFTWRWQDYDFTVLEYDYNTWMKMKFYKLDLE